MTKHNTTPATRIRDASTQPLTRHSKPLCEQVVAAVADAADTSSCELDPLYEVVNPEALNHLFAPTYEGGTRSDGRVTFEYAGHEVLIHSTGDVTVSPVDVSDEQRYE